MRILKLIALSTSCLAASAELAEKIRCRRRSEDTCRNSEGEAIGCAPKGGCPCEDPTYVRCGSTCQKACCDYWTEETCYEDGEVESCALIASGGCPCPDEQVKCHGTHTWSGVCVDVCW